MFALKSSGGGASESSSGKAATPLQMLPAPVRNQSVAIVGAGTVRKYYGKAQEVAEAMPRPAAPEERVLPGGDQLVPLSQLRVQARRWLLSPLFDCLEEAWADQVVEGDFELLLRLEGTADGRSRLVSSRLGEGATLPISSSLEGCVLAAAADISFRIPQGAVVRARFPFHVEEQELDEGAFRAELLREPNGEVPAEVGSARRCGSPGNPGMALGSANLFVDPLEPGESVLVLSEQALGCEQIAPNEGRALVVVLSCDSLGVRSWELAGMDIEPTALDDCTATAPAIGELTSGGSHDVRTSISAGEFTIESLDECAGGTIDAQLKDGSRLRGSFVAQVCTL